MKLHPMPLSFWLDVPEAFDGLDTFLRELETAIEKIIAEQSERASEEDWDPEMGQSPGSYRVALLEDALPRTLRYSAVLLAYAALDTLLAKLCDHVQERLGLRFSRTDMAHSRELRSRIRYLRNALGDALPADAFTGPFHAKLAAFSRARNLMAHAGGEITAMGPVELEKLDRQLAQLGFSAKGFSMSGTFIAVPHGAVRDLLGQARKWAEDACEAVQNALRARPSN